MRSLQKSVLLLAFVLGLPAMAEFWPNRDNVVRAAEVLAEEIEHFDTALHNIGAPAHVIQKVHHFEETVTEFANEVRNGLSRGEAESEMSHIRQDVQLIRDELSAHPHLLNDFTVDQEWRHVKTAYRNLDHEMLHWQGAGDDATSRALDREVEDMRASHE